MQVYFWGTRGSLPASITAATVREKIMKVLRQFNGRQFNDDEEMAHAVDRELPFTVRGTYGNNTPCVEIRGGDEYVLCDAGTGLRDFGNYHMRLIEHGKRRNGAVFNILISHFHWDHIQGFPFFTPAYIPGNKIRIYGYHSCLEEAMIHQQNGPYFPVPLKNLRADIEFISLTEGARL